MSLSNRRFFILSQLSFHFIFFFFTFFSFSLFLSLSSYHFNIPSLQCSFELAKFSNIQFTPSEFSSIMSFPYKFYGQKHRIQLNVTIDTIMSIYILILYYIIPFISFLFILLRL
ncbi:hypothetical protein F4703DRAFT_1843262, partial [Phycomyces blakesleeanus]